MTFPWITEYYASFFPVKASLQRPVQKCGACPRERKRDLAGTDSDRGEAERAKKKKER